MKARSSSSIGITITLELSEQEARVLHDLVAYGEKPFIEIYKERIGKSYVSQREGDAKLLFTTLLQELPKHLHKMDEVRRLLST